MALRKEYSDGDIEEYILKSLQNNPQHVFDLDSSWPLKYHFSPDRAKIIDWFDFPAGSRVLEVGAGLGAITCSIANQDISVTALELSERRASINRLRNKDRKNVEIITGNLYDFSPSIKFDYIVCIGVLEYAGSFIESPSPYKFFLEKLRSLLNQDGCLILAIENRLGLKYWSGAKEDHTGRIFDGIMGYPSKDGVETFGRKELKELILQSCFVRTSFYYPYPDYKLPRMLFSDDYYPGDGTCSFPLSSLPTPVFDSDRIHLFSETLAMINLERNDLFRDFSNSFLVFASTSDKLKVNQMPAYIINPSGRAADKNIRTTIEPRKSSNATLQVTKRALSSASIDHVLSMKDGASSYGKERSRSKGLTGVPLLSLEADSITMPYIRGRVLENELLSAIAGNNRRSVALIGEFIKRVEASSSKKAKQDLASLSDQDRDLYKQLWRLFAGKALKVSNWDLNLDNIVIGEDDEWYVFDYEWIMGFPIPADFAIARMLWYFFDQRHGETMRWLSNRIPMRVNSGCVVPIDIFKEYEAHFNNIKHVPELEDVFQAMVSNRPVQNNLKLLREPKEKKLTPKLGYIDSTRQENAEIITTLETTVKDLRNSLSTIKHELDQRVEEISSIKGSRGYLLLEKARKAKRIIKN